MDSTQRSLAVLASIFVLGTGSQWLAWRLRIPAILLLLGVGCAAGPVNGFIDPEAVFGELLLPIVSLSVGLILFEGGLNLRFHELRGMWHSLLGLLTVGVVVTWAGGVAAGIWVLNLPASVALILGAILTVTGPTVIGPLLRDIRPLGSVGSIAKWEGIIIDPVGAILALLVFEGISAIRTAEFGSATLNALAVLGRVGSVALLIGLAAAGLLAVMLQRFWIPDHLQNPMTLTFVVAAFAAAELLHHEAGLIAVTVMGIALANQRLVNVHQIMEFKESLTVLLIAALFILLSARVSIESLTSLGWRGPAFALVLILFVRPLAVWLSTLGSGMSFAERCFLSWLAPRGIVAAAVSSVFALRLGESGTAIAPAVLIVIFSTVAVYGLTAGPLARALGLSNPDAQGLLIAGASQSARAIAAVLVNHGFKAVLVDTRHARIRKSRDAGLTVCFANILSDSVLDEVEFGGLGRFLALTSNDGVNTLAVARFREIFGRDKVFQLPQAEAAHSRLEADWQQRLAGRTLFSPDLTYERLDRAFDDGASIKVTPLTETFGFDAYRSHYGVQAIPLFVIDGERLRIVTADGAVAPRPGQSIVGLVLPEAAELQAAWNAEEAAAPL